MTYHSCTRRIAVAERFLPVMKSLYTLDCFDDARQSHAVRRFLRDQKLVEKSKRKDDAREILALFRLPLDGTRVRGIVLMREPGQSWLVVGQQSHPSTFYGAKIGWEIPWFLKCVSAMLYMKVRRSRPRPLAAHLCREVCSL